MRRPLITLAIAALACASTQLAPTPAAAGPVATTGALFVARTAAQPASPSVDPSFVHLTLRPGQSTTLTKRVTTSPIPPNPDLVFLADTTASMGSALINVRDNAKAITDAVVKAQPTAQFGVAAYKDEDAFSTYLFRRETDITPDTNAVKAGAGRWVTEIGGGGDLPESGINALYELATGALTSEAMHYRPDDTKIVAWFGDAPSHNPSNGRSIDDAIAQLKAAKIRVVAVSVRDPNPDHGQPGLDAAFDDDEANIHIPAGQAKRITDETGGVLLDSTDTEVAQKILLGIQKVKSTVSPHVEGAFCDPHLDVVNTPASVTVDSGDTATFTETVSVTSPIRISPGTIFCTVDYLIDGVSRGVIENTSVTVENVPPTVSAGGPYAGNQNTDVVIVGTVTDPDSAVVTTAWSIAATGDVPPGSHCVFGNAAAPSTTVNCDQHGTYILTLTANDGVNSPVTDTTTLTLRNVPPAPSAGGPYAGNQNNDIAIAGTVKDPDGPTLTTTWSIMATGDVLPGSNCVFGNAAALSTTVNCNQHGTYTLTLTAVDGFNPAVSTSTTVTVINQAPKVSAGGPYSGNQNNAVPIAGTVTDPDGPSLTTRWSIEAETGVPDNRFNCTFGDATALSTTVTCDQHGTYRLTLTANDSVNAPVSATAEVTFINVPPTVSAGGPYKGNQGNQVPIVGTATDPDGPALSSTWTIEAVNDGSVPEGSVCTFGNPNALSTTVSCTERGNYILTLTVTDGVNKPVSATANLTLVNVPSTVSAGGPYTGEEDHPVAIIGTVVDPDSPGLTTTWTIKPNLGTAICSFTDPSQLSTVVTCSEPGVYTLTLTADDPADGNPPVVATAVVSLSLTPGALSLISSVAPAPGYVGGDAVVVTQTVHNAGPAAMPGVRLVTTLPTGMQPTAVDLAGCTAASCDLGTLAPGQTVQVRFSFSPSATVDTLVSATVTTPGPDLDRGDNSGSVRVVIRQPTLTIDPSTGPQGFVTHATGKDFPPGARVRLQWSIGISETPGEVTVRADGTLDAQALVFPKDVRGLRNLQAVPVSGPNFGMVTSNPFLVFLPSLKPLSFVIR